MINRALLRIKIIQVLYAVFHTENISQKDANTELNKALNKAYDLYFYLLQLMVDLTQFAEQKIDAARNKFLPTEEEKNPKMRFVENAFVRQLAENEELKAVAKEKKINWANQFETLRLIFREIEESDFYQEYMNAKTVSYEDEKNIWKKILKMEFRDESPLLSVLEDENAYWLSDIDIIGSFVMKTIKLFNEDTDSTLPLMPMYEMAETDDNDNKKFAEKLFNTALLNSEEYDEMINEHLKNWELNRLAFMDRLIMRTAIAELLAFPTIPTSVTLNEYIEIAKMFSTPHSSMFINGILDKIVNNLKANNKLEKLVDFAYRKK